MKRVFAALILVLSACVQPAKSDSWSPLISLPVDQILSEFVAYETLDPTVEVWTVHGEVVEGYNCTDEPAFFAIGRSDWQSYAVELEVLMPSDQTLRLAVGSDVLDGEQRFRPLEFEPTSEDWFTLRLEVIDDNYRILDPVSGEAWGEGGVLFEKAGLTLLLPRDHRLALRNIRYSLGETR